MDHTGKFFHSLIFFHFSLQDKPSSTDKGKVRLISFAREEFDEGLEFLKKNCYIRRNSDDDRPLMFTCGLDGVQYGKKIEDELNTRL